MRFSEVVAGLGLLVCVALGLSIGTLVNRKRNRLAPRHRRRFDRKHQVLIIAVVIGNAVMMFLQGHVFLAYVVVIGGAVVIIQIFNQPMKYNDIEARLNYAHDDGCCGRCDYDLTGNESGVCPECGWRVPETREYVEPPHWTNWWKSWHIEHIDNWQKALAGVVFNLLAVLGCAMLIVLLYRQGWLVVLLVAGPFMANWLILIWRIIAYARRQRAQG
jgi:hypothetical protein